ncbi:hypothetical protein HFU84_08360 [Acidithiobacillus sp. CV18-2]|uniref:Uncharacterized protein n=1 Tax=Igneacidithiobacillus copahuensis TaxID=2724909 RepID=A0AAE2YPM3_9PROT|nr:hypothetical protein [Igneacidithiobacillus copahuensis]MBU2755687.1 hypothetical protein [Acidithiobacillus sp. CV18-3]MBU2758257.1 hypothetical protein [Acidithiobacillus sp. BN09-2]MBU2777515.1 hypothetical protein [Acidithiobacillus sp. CV18-2]MBU2796829.1 hypothetical protein [Acidithiobacillus sp. VAN18-2]MBU2800439.1 hypothetical protein [Acidithiobacillus sp. VAN18-4]UTV80216.1 hypothetical protein MQE22_09300 [Acidithiobacillus sp. YTS05]
MDTHAQHQANLLDGLEAVSRFGWLTRDQITRILWPGSSTAATREKLGQRLLGKAQEKGLLLRWVIDGGGSAYVLRPAGVGYLKSFRPTVPAKSGLDFRLGNVRHRSLANNIILQRMLEGGRVWTEYEILTRRTPQIEIAGKIPDGAVFDLPGSLSGGMDWIEVEAHARKRRDFEALCEFIRGPLEIACRPGGYQIAEGEYLGTLGLYFADDHLGALLTHRLLQVAHAEDWPDTLRDSIELYWAQQTPGSRWDGLKQVGTLLYLPESWATKKLSALESSLT